MFAQTVWQEKSYRIFIELFSFSTYATLLETLKCDVLCTMHTCDNAHVGVMQQTSSIIILGSFLILLLRTYMMEKVLNVLKNRKYFFFEDKLSPYNMTPSSGLRSWLQENWRAKV